MLSRLLSRALRLSICGYAMPSSRNTLCLRFRDTVSLCLGFRDTVSPRPRCQQKGPMCARSVLHFWVSGMSFYFLLLGARGCFTSTYYSLLPTPMGPALVPKVRLIYTLHCLGSLAGIMKRSIACLSKHTFPAVSLASQVEQFSICSSLWPQRPPTQSLNSSRLGILFFSGTFPGGIFPEPHGAAPTPRWARGSSVFDPPVGPRFPGRLSKELPIGLARRVLPLLDNMENRDTTEIGSVRFCFRQFLSSVKLQ